MKFENVSDYEKYIVLADRSGGKLGWTWDRFLNFKKVMEEFYKIRPFRRIQDSDIKSIWPEWTKFL